MLKVILVIHSFLFYGLVKKLKYLSISKITVHWCSITPHEYWWYLEFSWSFIWRYSIFLNIQPECGKIGTRKTPNTATFHAILYKISYKRIINRYFIKNINIFFTTLNKSCRFAEIFVRRCSVKKMFLKIWQSSKAWGLQAY